MADGDQVLHPTRWRELEPQVKAQGLLKEAEELLSRSNPIAATAVRTALQRLPPAVRSEAGRQEFQKRLEQDDRRQRFEASERLRERNERNDQERSQQQQGGQQQGGQQQGGQQQGGQ